jgi:hypothetical protein
VLATPLALASLSGLGQGARRRIDRDEWAQTLAKKRARDA